MPKKEAPRRNPLEPPDDKQSSMWQTVLSQIGAPERLEAARKPKTKERKREWEKANPSRCYRGVPAEIREQIKEVAEELGVTADEVARAFLEYGLYCMERETLTIQPKIKGTRMTLYPLDSGWTKQHGWVEDGWNPTPKAVSSEKRKRKQKGEEPRLWTRRVSYRLPEELVKRLKEKADKHNVPVGELVGLLLKHSTNRYEQGILRLIPYPKQDAQARWEEGQ